MVDRPRVLSLCSGIGALDLAARIAFPGARTVCYVEREAFSTEALAAAMEAACLDPAPVWTDLTSFDARAWRGAVDLVVSGIPCQPYSRAGQRRGNDDERALWPELVRVVAECEPAAVFIENTPDLRKHAEPLWGELRGLGFEWAPPLLSTASEVGAIHDRERLFLWASHPDRPGLPQREGERGHAREELEAVERGGGSPADGWAFDTERQRFRHNAVGCSGCRVCGSYWEAESPVCRVDDGASARVDWLRALGNAVVPEQAAMALLELSGQ